MKFCVSVCIVLFAILLSFVLSSCQHAPPPVPDSEVEGSGEDSKPEESENYYIGELVRGLGNSTVRVVMDYRKFFGDNTVFSRDIATVSLVFDTQASMGQLGLGNIVYRQVGLEDNDRSGLIMGHRRVVYNGDVREIVLVRITGYTRAHWAHTALEENFSNIDVGANIPEYFEMTGSNHPDWTERLNFKGFDVTAGRIITEIESYLRDYVSDAQPVLWITGFSRGGAISNIVGAYFERQEDIITFVYPFASPGVTTSEAARGYQTIFNIINEDDMVTLFPPPSWGFSRFGTDLSVSVALHGKEAFFEMMGIEYIYYSDVLSLIDGVGKRFPNRESLFLLYDNVYFISGDFSSRADAEAEKYRLESILQPELKQFSEIHIREMSGGNGYYVIIYQAPALLLKAFAYVVSGGNPANLYLADEFAQLLSELAPAYMLSGMGHPHLGLAYYIIVTMI